MSDLDRVERDLRERKDSLSRELAYERGLREFATALLDGPPEKNVPVKRAMNSLMEVTHACRMYFFENVGDAKEGDCMRQVHEVCAPGVRPEITNPILQHLPYAAGFNRWHEKFSAGQPILGEVAGMSEAERQILEPQDITSIAVLPVDVDGALHGFIGVDSTAGRRNWSDRECDVLAQASRLLGLYLSRERVARQQDQLAGAVSRYFIARGRDGKTLQMCASCREICDGSSGDWQDLESYLYEHVGIMFSHGICPECTSKLYPGLYARLYEGRDK